MKTLRWFTVIAILFAFVAFGVQKPAQANFIQNNTYQTLPFSQNWTNTNLITTDDDWSGVPGIIGYRGDNLTTTNDTDPQTVLNADDSGVIDVNANQTNPNTYTTGGVTEFHITDPVVALQGSTTADAPYLKIYLNTTGYGNIRVQYKLRDIDGSTDNAVQQVALHYRVGESGSFTNVPAAYVSDATEGPSLSGKVTPIDVVLPEAVNNQPQVQLRIMTTNAAGNDEWVGIDDIVITGLPLTPHSIGMDGQFSPGEWHDGEKLGTGENSVQYYLTWDATWIYVGMIGGDISQDKYNVLIDIDPDDVGDANSGTISEYCGATFGADGKPDYALQKYSGGVAKSKASSGSWEAWTPSGDTDAASAVYNQVEFKIQRSDIGNPTGPIALYLYTCNASGRIWSSWPATNPQSSANIEELPTAIYIPALSDGKFPRYYTQWRGDQTRFNADGSFSLLNGFVQVNITNGGGTGCHFRVDLKANAPADTDNSAVRRVYTLTPDGCTPTADITLKYIDGTEGWGAVNELNGHTESSLKLWRWDGSAWVDEGGTVDTGANTVTKTGVSTFSPWTFGSTQPTATTVTRVQARTAAWPFAAGAILLLGAALLRRKQ